MSRQINWDKLVKLAYASADKMGLDDNYIDRLDFEIKEINKQGANQYWVDLFNTDYKYDTNDNGLVLPYVLKMTKVDPLITDHKIERSTDLPDIDVDCLPEARDKIKAYAAERYGHEYVCSVGTWLTYKFKSAIQDAARALSADLKEAIELTKSLPDDVDELKDGGYANCSDCGTEHKLDKCPNCDSTTIEGVTIGQLLKDYKNLDLYNSRYPEVVSSAVRMVGKIKAMGKHAGGIIITNRKLMGNVPMGLSTGTDGSKQWTSMWTEGRTTQLSKLGYVKWDILGLKTLQYIHEACLLAEKTRGVRFDRIPWRENDPEDNCAGYYWDANGDKIKVSMEDPDVFEMINNLRVETLFQFETDVQRGVLSNQVHNFYDLQVFNAMGHPGPIAYIPEYVDRRNDVDKSWMAEEHPEVAQELMDTHGIICYEQNQRVSLADGREIPIRDIKVGDLIHSVDVTNKKVEIWPVVACGQTGQGSGIRITLCNGYMLTVTADHKIYTPHGMIPAHLLGIGDLVGVAANLPSDNNNALGCDWLGDDANVSYLMGQLVGDGQLTGTSTSICVGSKDAVDTLESWLNNNLPKIKTRRYFNTRAWYLCLKCGEKIGRYSRLRELTKQFGLRKRHDAKRIPEQIMVGNKDIKASFLAGLIDSDGCLFVTKRGFQVAYISSISDELLQDIRRLCSGLGLATKLYLDHHRIYIYNTVGLNSLCAKYCLKQFKGKLLDGSSISFVPKADLDDIRGDQSVREFCRVHSINRRGYNLAGGSVRYATAIKCGATYGDVRFNRIHNIEVIDDCVFYNLTVEPHHTLVVNGIIASNCFQEQLQRLWQKFGGFTAPEAESARKAIAKKWREKLKGIEAKWKEGAAKTLGTEWADKMWDRMQSFGRYAFNKSHSCSYILIAYWCAWLKTHFAPEWWASVMSGCHSDRIPRYMNTARFEGVEFGPINVDNMTKSFTVSPELQVTPGLTSIKGIGDKAASKLVGKHKINSIDDFVAVYGKSKTVIEPLIKLGAFKKFHDNAYATWMWYQYKYCSGKEITKLKQEIRDKLLERWTDELIEEYRDKYIGEFRKEYPNRKVPKKLLEWKPPINDTRENVMSLYPDDYNLKHVLEFEKQYLGYYWHSPLGIYDTRGYTIEDLKKSEEDEGYIEFVIEDVEVSKTKNDKTMARLLITDGVSNSKIILWEDQYNKYKRRLTPGRGLSAYVSLDRMRGTFTLSGDNKLYSLKKKPEFVENSDEE